MVNNKDSIFSKESYKFTKSLLEKQGVDLSDKSFRQKFYRTFESMKSQYSDFSEDTLKSLRNEYVTKYNDDKDVMNLLRADIIAGLSYESELTKLQQNSYDMFLNMEVFAPEPENEPVSDSEYSESVSKSTDEPVQEEEVSQEEEAGVDDAVESEEKSQSETEPSDEPQQDSEPDEEPEPKTKESNESFAKRVAGAAAILGEKMRESAKQKSGDVKPGFISKTFNKMSQSVKNKANEKWGGTKFYEGFKSVLGFLSEKTSKLRDNISAYIKDATEKHQVVAFRKQTYDAYMKADEDLTKAWRDLGQHNSNMHYRADTIDNGLKDFSDEALKKDFDETLAKMSKDSKTAISMDDVIPNTSLFKSLTAVNENEIETFKNAQDAMNAYDDSVKAMRSDIIKAKTHMNKDNRFYDDMRNHMNSLLDEINDVSYSIRDYNQTCDTMYEAWSDMADRMKGSYCDALRSRIGEYMMDKCHEVNEATKESRANRAKIAESTFSSAEAEEPTDDAQFE